MRVAITGATGLLGSHLANNFLKDGHQVFALIKDETSKSVLSANVTKVYGDMTNKGDVEYFIQKSNPTHFIHLAAQTQAYDSLKYPYQTFYNNLVGTLNVLECLREFQYTNSIIVASSDKAYGELTEDEYLENHRLNGIYPYDASKSSTDIIANSYRITYSMPIVVTRACNIYGIGDLNRQRLIPGIVNSFLEGRDFIIRNGGLDIREYIHVNDVVAAYRAIIDYQELNGKEFAFNISSGHRFSTQEVFDAVQEKVGKSIPFKMQSKLTLEIRQQFMNSTLLRTTTGWLPKVEFKESLTEIVPWYIENL
jgi:CDP-glucose 4,6-dehydratase